MLAAACAGDDDDTPTRLFDGSPAGEVPIELQDLAETAVFTRVDVVTLASVEPGSSASACVREWQDDRRAGSLLVRRIGAYTETVTFGDVSGRWLLGCDDSGGSREAGRRWCGSSAGRLYDGRLRDPRLDILCTTAEGAQIGFAWLEPDRAARYVAVEQSGHAEVYETAGDLPIRVATTGGVSIEESAAHFDISEFDGEGRLLSEYELEARVAG